MYLGIRKAKAKLEVEVDNVETALEKYSSTADEVDLENLPSAEVLQKVVENNRNAGGLLDKARTAFTTFIGLKEELLEADQGTDMEQNRSEISAQIWNRIAQKTLCLLYQSPNSAVEFGNGKRSGERSTMQYTRAKWTICRK